MRTFVQSGTQSAYACRSFLVHAYISGRRCEKLLPGAASREGDREAGNGGGGRGLILQLTSFGIFCILYRGFGLLVQILSVIKRKNNREREKVRDKRAGKRGRQEERLRVYLCLTQRGPKTSVDASGLLGGGGTELSPPPQTTGQDPMCCPHSLAAPTPLSLLEQSLL